MDLDDEELKATRMMNGADRNSKVRFSEEIKVSKEIQEAINGVSKRYKEQGRKLEEEDKNKLVIYLNKLDQERNTRNESRYI